MSKRIIASCLIIGALAGSNALASQARQQVLGTLDPMGVVSNGTHGSVLVDDNYNVFYNPSYAVDFSNWAAIEKSVNGTGGAASSGAEGGFLNNFGPVTAGVYLNRGNAANQNFAQRSAALFGANAPGTGTATASVAAAGNTRPFDIIVAGDMGVKWGLMYSHSSGKSGPTLTDSRKLDATESHLRAGVQVMGFEPYAAITLSGSNKVAGTAATDIDEDKFRTTEFGVRYKFGEWVPFASVRMDKYTNGPAAAGGSSREHKGNAYGVGFARNTKLAEGASLNYGAAYWSLTGPVATNAAANPSERATRKVLPINVSVEADATSWLVLRGGLAYSLLDQTNSITNTGATTGRLGAGLKFGKAMMDWAIGGSSGGVGNVDSNTFDFANGMFTTASLTYSW